MTIMNCEKFFTSTLNFAYCTAILLRRFVLAMAMNPLIFAKNLMNLIFAVMLFLQWDFAWAQKEEYDYQYILQNTKLSIDPLGSKILVIQGLKTESPNALIVQRKSEKFSLTREFPVRADLRHLSFSSSAQYLLEISRIENLTTLARVNVETNQRQVIYRESKEIWLPKEIGVDDYVYFQATAQTSSQGVWVRQKSNLQKVLFSVPNRISSRMNLAGDSLYVMNWTSPRTFFALTGKVPAEAERLAKEDDVWEIFCSDSAPLQCARHKLKLTRHGYLATVEMTNGLQKCVVPGQWFDLRELQISASGEYAIFHAKASGGNGIRSIYLTRYAEEKCALDVVFSERDGKWELQ
ncbi:hypothetical protein SAMN05518854_108176 [Variovorax sp. YR266]|uniref:hypothetical protein n=1 Tax=Variovorax sp. YR266 TaxID=1884386 RepID=UPI0008986844|nr:hypothetical protein [Variovorax sp. YR266]SDZ60235.1 hypothetical protein SAMN05518854_108176 [Variovorax sp. YR266]